MDRMVNKCAKCDSDVTYKGGFWKFWRTFHMKRAINLNLIQSGSVQFRPNQECSELNIPDSIDCKSEPDIFRFDSDGFRSDLDGFRSHPHDLMCDLDLFKYDSAIFTSDSDDFKSDSDVFMLTSELYILTLIQIKLSLVRKTHHI